MELLKQGLRTDDGEPITNAVLFCPRNNGMTTELQEIDAESVNNRSLELGNINKWIEDLKALRSCSENIIVFTPSLEVLERFISDTFGEKVFEAIVDETCKDKGILVASTANISAFQKNGGTHTCSQSMEAGLNLQRPDEDIDV